MIHCSIRAKPTSDVFIRLICAQYQQLFGSLLNSRRETCSLDRITKTTVPQSKKVRWLC
ncbi:hypothetical protein PILCRDRAFT_821311 [Piloderma croceum F 1598]|uniref:Uncharacterized protein n=1 Tax=Piloderma croceum (strain F 1598) TaxID=765440 RepID=A0A0C3FQT5_PILCF|nr:hypothetical protein PILCRDRAFT_821311 [Piloderma croceum F 1598]